MDLNGSAFKISLGILKFYGVYQPVVSKWSVRRAIFFLSFVNLQFLVASLINIFSIKDFNELIVAVIYVIFCLNLTFRLICFKVLEKKVIELIDEIDGNDQDEPKFTQGNMNILKFMGTLLGCDFLIGFILCLSIIIFSTKKAFTVPQLYNPENEIIYLIMFVIHYFQIMGIGSMAHGEFGNTFVELLTI
jgi:hypothetical protein